MDLYHVVPDLLALNSDDRTVQVEALELVLALGVLPVRLGGDHLLALRAQPHLQPTPISQTSLYSDNNAQYVSYLFHPLVKVPHVLEVLGEGDGLVVAARLAAPVDVRLVQVSVHVRF